MSQPPSLDEHAFENKISNLPWKEEQNLGKSAVEKGIRYIKECIKNEEYKKAWDRAEHICQFEIITQNAFQTVFSCFKNLLKCLPGKNEKLSHLFLENLKKSPAMRNEQISVLKFFGENWLHNEHTDESLEGALKCFATAYSLDLKDENVHKKMSSCLFYLFLNEFERQLKKAVDDQNTAAFKSLLDKIPQLHQKFSRNAQDIQKYYQIAYEIYNNASSRGQACIKQFVARFQDGEHEISPLADKPPLTQIYRNKLLEARKIFENPGENLRTLQTQRTGAFHKFYCFLIKDLQLLLGKAPCNYDIRALGSFARDELVPYSDLEYCIWIDQEGEFPPEYFTTFAKLFELQILTLGEAEPENDLYDFGQKFGLTLDPVGNPTKDGVISAPDKFFESPSSNDPPKLKSFKSRLCSISLYSNHAFELPSLKYKDFAKTLLAMRREEFANLSVLQSNTCNIKNEFAEPLFHFLGDLGLYFGIEQSNTLDIIEALPCLDELSKMLLKKAVSDIYHLRTKLHLTYEGLQETASRVPTLDLPVLTQADQKILNTIHQLILIPLYQANLDESIDLIQIAFLEPTSQVVEGAAQFLKDAPYKIHEKYYRMLNASDRAHLQTLYLEQVPEDIKQILAEIPNRAGYRQSRRFEEQELYRRLEQITTDDSKSRVKIQCPLIGEKYLTIEASTQLLEKGHIARKCGGLHPVNTYGNLHFKELPYQPLMEYAIYSLTHRIMGKASPTTTLARMQVGDDPAFPVLISETIEGDMLEENTSLLQKHLTWLRLCEILIKPGDGRSPNYVVQSGKIYCVDNDVSFSPLVYKPTIGQRKISFCSILFTLNHPLEPSIYQEFCSLDRDEILSDWLEELQRQEKHYESLFPDTQELEQFYADKETERFTPTLILEKGTIAELSMQFYHLQEILRQNPIKDPIYLLQALISLEETEKNQLGYMVASQYQKALKYPFSKRLEIATKAKAEQLMSSKWPMQHNYKKIPTFEEIEAKATYSLQEAREELGIMLVQSIWKEGALILNKETKEYALEADFSKVEDLEREKLMLKALKFLFDAKIHKPQSLTLRSAKTLTSDILQGLLHPELKSLDLSYGAITESAVTLFGWTLYALLETKCPNLENLHLEGCPNLKNFTLKHPKLKTLNLSRCTNLQKYNPDFLSLVELRVNYTPLDPVPGAFGPIDWLSFFGDIGNVPPLPSNIEEILQSPCPFWPEQKVSDTHFLCLIPKTVNGKPLTLDNLQKLVKMPKRGNPTKYRHYFSEIQKEYGSRPVENSYWVLMTKDVIPGSRNKTYEAQKALVEKTAPYKMPRLIEAATVIFMHTFKTGGHIYTDSELGKEWTYTRCQEKIPEKQQWPLVIGGLSAAGLGVDYGSFDYDSCGVSGSRKF